MRITTGFFDTVVHVFFVFSDLKTGSDESCICADLFERLMNGRPCSLDLTAEAWDDGVKSLREIKGQYYVTNVYLDHGLESMDNPCIDYLEFDQDGIILGFHKQGNVQGLAFKLVVNCFESEKKVDQCLAGSLLSNPKLLEKLGYRIESWNHYGDGNIYAAITKGWKFVRNFGSDWGDVITVLIAKMGGK